MGKKIYNTLIDEAYNDFVQTVERNRPDGYTKTVLTRDEFIWESKFHSDFSEHWKFKIEERELVQRERIKLLHNAWKDNGILPEDDEVSTLWIDYKNLMIKYNIPTKKITVTYKDEIIEFYE
jgi:hypothetical protein